ncbi:MAG: response regulator [Acidimicrobiia bacterium]|nr:response regulator [Acidimicrobiia bacterium]
MVGTAGDAQKAIDLCRSRQPDALLLDVRMPRGGGQRVIAELRDELPDLRVVVLSATDDAATRTASTVLGADDYLVKGTGSGDILASLKVACRPCRWSCRAGLRRRVDVVGGAEGGGRHARDARPFRRARPLGADRRGPCRWPPRGSRRPSAPRPTSWPPPSARTAEEAGRLAREQRPRVALVDYRLPDGTGAQAAAQLRDGSPEHRQTGDAWPYGEMEGDRGAAEGHRGGAPPASST